jgi:ketosteroid isomerase-like protein
MTDHTRFYRPGSFPFIDDESRKKLFSETDKKFNYEMIDGAVSSTGDFGYVYGKAIIEAINDGSARKQTGNYLRIWKKEKGEWKIVLDLVNLAR